MVQANPDWRSDFLDLADSQGIQDTKNHQILDFQSRARRKSVAEKESTAGAAAPSKGHSRFKYRHG
jgi:hypothetical protein